MLSEITIEYKGKNIEVLYDALFLVNIFSYSVIDQKDFADITHSKANWDYIDDDALSKYGKFPYVNLFLEANIVDEKLKELTKTLKSLNVKKQDYVIYINEYKEFDWFNKWKEFYKVIDIGKFQIIPIWKKDTFKYSKLPVYINPSIAFGTGEHESTKIALYLLSQVSFVSKVLDVGTGSGILGIASSKMGAKEVHLIDIDFNALQNTKENVLLNDALAQCKIYQSSFLSNVIDKFDLIISNMTADLNLKLLKNLKKVSKDKSKIILSGILLNRKKEVIENYLKFGFNLVAEKNIGEWVGFLLEHTK